MIVIIGASSFIGVYTVDAFLNAGYEVFATGRNDRFRDYYLNKGVGFSVLDVTDPKSFQNLPQDHVDCVILLGALLPANATVNIDIEENAKDYILVNTVGTANALEYCRTNQIPRLISTTSYAETSAYFKKDYYIDESLPRKFSYTGDHCAYVISKVAAADLMEYYNEQHGMKNIVFRLPAVYGAGPHGQLYDNGTIRKSGIQIFMEKARMGQDIVVYGDGTISRDVVYVKDVADAFVKASVSEGASGLYNIASGIPKTLSEQANIIADLFQEQGGRSHVICDTAIQNKTPSYAFSIQKARNEFGYHPKYADFKDMMADYKLELANGQYGSLFDHRK